MNCLSLKEFSEADDAPLLVSSTGANVKVSCLVTVTVGCQSKPGAKCMSFMLVHPSNSYRLSSDRDSLSVRKICTLTDSDSGRYGGDTETIKDMVTGLHWLSRSTHELLVAYLFHRVV